MTTMLTTETITLAQIRALGVESGEHGDLLQAAICYLAEHGELSERIPLDDAEQARVAQMTQEQARKICVRVINDNTLEAVQCAIERSASRGEIVHLTVDPPVIESVIDELLSACDDSADHPHGEREFWGVDESGAEWRVHVREERE